MIAGVYTEVRVLPRAGLLASSLMKQTIYMGNAVAEASTHGGWLLGHFKPVDDARHSEDVEIKWSMYRPGVQRERWVTGESRSAVVLLISGRFRVELPGRSVLLAQQGDYVVFRGVSHSWQAEEDSIVLTVRWPSIPGYAVNE